MKGANADTEHIQIKANIRVSESLINESYTSEVLGNTRVFNVNLQSLTNAEFEESNPELDLFWLTVGRAFNLEFTNNKDYPIRLMWTSNSVQISNTSLPVNIYSWMVSTGFFPSRTAFIDYANLEENSKTLIKSAFDYRKMIMPIGDSLYSYNSNYVNYLSRRNKQTIEPTSGYLVIPPHSSFKESNFTDLDTSSMRFFIKVPENIKSSATVTFDFYVIKDFDE